MYHNYKMAKKKKKNDELASTWTIEFEQREEVSREKVALPWFYELSYCVNWLPPRVSLAEVWSISASSE